MRAISYQKIWIFLIIAIVPLVAVQAETLWTGPAFGDWATSENWSAGTPDSSVDALIDTGLAATSGSGYTATAATLTIGGSGTAGLGIGNNTILAVTDLILGRDAASSGLISVGSGAEVRSADSLNSSLIIGQNGTGTLSTTASAEVNIAGPVIVGQNTGSQGSILLNGGDLMILGPLNAARAGSATITINNGGHLTAVTLGAASSTVGDEGGIATISVTGSDSYLSLASLQVMSASTFTVGNGGTINLQNLSDGAGQWTLDAGGRVTVSDVTTLSADSHITFTLQGTASSDYGRFSSDEITFAGQLTIALGLSYAPALGDRFTLFGWIYPTFGAFDIIDLPTLGAGLAWDTSTLYTSGAIEVVPEPSTWLLLAIGLAASFVFKFPRRRA